MVGETHPAAKQPIQGGSGGMTPQKIFLNMSVLRCILAHSGREMVTVLPNTPSLVPTLSPTHNVVACPSHVGQRSRITIAQAECLGTRLKAHPRGNAVSGCA